MGPGLRAQAVLSDWLEELEGERSSSKIRSLGSQCRDSGPTSASRLLDVSGQGAQWLPLPHFQYVAHRPLWTVTQWSWGALWHVRGCTAGLQL